MRFVWDEWNIDHIARHDVLPQEAEEVISNEPYELAVQFVNGEERFIVIGETNTGRVLIVVTAWDEEDETTRVVTVLKPSAAKRKEYMAWKGSTHGRNIKDSGLRQSGRRGRVVGREPDDG